VKIKAEILEKIINDEIKDVGRGNCDSSAFAIHEDTRIQVQVLITRDRDDFLDEVLPEYAEN
jgi:hypothetical protein